MQSTESDHLLVCKAKKQIELITVAIRRLIMMALSLLFAVKITNGEMPMNSSLVQSMDQ